MALESLVLNGLALNDGTNFILGEMTFVPAQKKPLLITNPAADGPALVQESHYTESSFELTLRVKQQATMTAALAKAGELVDRLQSCERFEGGVPVEWKPGGSASTYTAYAISADILELPTQADGDLAGWVLRAPVVKIKLLCRPFLYSNERTAKAAVESAAEPQQVVYVPDVLGDVPAEARLILTDKATQVRRYVEIGQDLVASETNPSVLIAAASLTTTGFSGAAAENASAYPAGAGNVKRCTAPSGSWTVSCGTGVITNVGTYRVKVRVQGNTTIRFRLSYRNGDGPLTKLEPVAVPVGAALCELDLGEITLDQAVIGSQKGEIRIEVMTTGAKAVANIDTNYLRLVPTAVGWGRARGTAGGDTSVSLIAYDDFLQAEAFLAAPVTMPVGGNWGGTGVDAVDFKVIAAADVARRSEKSDADLNSGRYAIAGTNEATSSKVAISVAMASNPVANSWRHGVFLRYTDTNNWLAAVVASGSAVGASDLQASLLVLKRVGGGAPTVLGEGLAFTSAGEIFPTTATRVALMAESGGHWKAWVYPTSMSEPASPLLSGFDSDLAEGSGKSVAKGKAGIYDVETSAVERNRDYDDFLLSEQTAAGVTCYSTRTAEWRSDGFQRQDSTGVYYGTPSLFRGANLYIPHEGAEGAFTRLVIAMRRTDIDTEIDANVTDKHSAEVKVRERYLVPR